MPLVEPLSLDADEEVRKLARFYNETLGFCPNSVLTMQHHPGIAKAFIEMNKAVMANHGRVTSALKRLVAYVTSNTAGCRYCQAHSIRAAERYGAVEDQMENIWEYRTHPSFDEAERAALDLALASSTVPTTVTDELHERVRRYWDDGEIVEIVGVIALFGYLNRWNDTMATSLEEGAADSGFRRLSAKGWEPGKHK